MSLTQSYYPANTTRPVLDLTLGQVLRGAAHDAPHHTALVGISPDSSPRSWTYQELLEDAERAAAWLLARFHSGAHIAVWAANDPEWLILQCATALAGMTLVTANPALRGAELAHVLISSDAEAVAFPEEVRGTAMAPILYEALDRVRLRSHATLAPIPSLIPFVGWLDAVRETSPAADLPLVEPGDPIQLQFTSGTTGAPKPAQLSHRAMITNADFTNARGGMIAPGVAISPLPLFHTAGSGLAGFGTFLARGTLVLCRTFDPDLVLSAIETYGATDLRMVPAMYRQVMDRLGTAPGNFDTIRVLFTGGDALPLNLSRSIEATFQAPLTTVYGQTELSPILAQTSPYDAPATRWGTAGRPLEQVEVKIIEPGREALASLGADGEICARGYQVISGYYGMPDATAELIDAEGWLHTGDLGHLDEDGYLTVTGRLKDLIIRGGENVYPREVEEAVLQHESVAAVGVVGIPDEHWGEIVAAVLVHAAGSPALSAQGLKDFLRPILSPQKIPTQWFMAESLPANAMGKLQKHRLLRGVTQAEYAQVA